MVIYGLNKPPTDVKAGAKRQRLDKQVVAEMFGALKVKVDEEDVKFTARIGKLTESAATNPRPLKLSFRNLKIREDIFNKAKNLPKTKFHALSIVPDLTDQQRQQDKELFAEAEKKNAKMSEEDGVDSNTSQL